MSHGGVRADHQGQPSQHSRRVQEAAVSPFQLQHLETPAQATQLFGAEALLETDQADALDPRQGFQTRSRLCKGKERQWSHSCRGFPCQTTPVQSVAERLAGSQESLVIWSPLVVSWVSPCSVLFR
jgi:hypothetical protein